jgi:hypothetical protein
MPPPGFAAGAHARFDGTTISEWKSPVTSATTGFSIHVHDEWY